MKKLLTLMAMIFAMVLPVAVSAESNISAPNISVTTSTTSTSGTASFTLKSDTSGVNIYYTTNGNDPTTSSSRYTGKVTLKQTAEVRAVAYDTSTKEYSDVGYYLVTVTQPQVQKLTFSAADVAGGRKITIKTATSGATIYYTTDGSTPTTSSKRYSSPFTVTEATTVRAMAVKSGFKNSGIYRLEISVPQLSKPTITTASASNGTKVTFKATSGAKIYYTTNGATPTTSSKSVASSGSITVTQACTVRAIAVKNGYQNSDVAERDIEGARVAYPEPTLTAIYGGYQVKLTSATSGATIYYTTDGSDPAVYGKKYGTSGFEITEVGTTQVRAIAKKSGMDDSQKVSFTKTLTKTSKPTGTIATSSGKRTLTLKGSTSDTYIYYTKNGTTPTTKSTKYSSAITVTSGFTLKAIAVRKGYAASDVLERTISAGAAEEPTLSSKTAIVGGVNVKLKTATSSATIYYTTDGSTPTTSSTKYTTSGINITSVGTTEIRAIAVKSGYENSGAASIPVTVSRLAAPTASKETTSSGTKITLKAATGATIYYTTDGSTPTTSSKKFTTSGSFTMTKSFTLKTFAVMKGYANSNIASASVEVTNPKAENPTATLKKYSTYVSVTFKTATSGAKIYYTTDGRDPSVYGKSISSGSSVKIYESCRVRAVAKKSGYDDSDIVGFNVNLDDDDTSYLSVEQEMEIDGPAAGRKTPSLDIPFSIDGILDFEER